MKTVAFTFSLLLAMAAFGEKQPFDRYEGIVERQMFGPLPPGFDASKLPSEVQKTSSKEEKELSKEQEKLKSAIVFSVINVDPDGETKVGFTDNSDPKVPRNYYLKVGESRDGWTVKEADPTVSTMTIVKGEIEVTLSLGGNSAKGAGSVKSVAGGGSAASTPRSHTLFSPTSPRTRRQRREQEQQELARRNAELKEREAALKAQQEEDKAQREADRAEQKQQLSALSEELKRLREAKATEKSGEENAGAANEQNKTE